ncbi:restriction endonuclease subunit S [Paenalcaligenes faecalis]|uniref:restriction endonuclease subunit S n=1 Tax=Paenalcaligenes faecalis TaxID=2980099 RepID=UPI0022B9CE47|nr:restriction endonuclease subunit S [Paenalcaligenes faecalis]
MGKYKAYLEYRESGVEWIGEIPSQWPIIKNKYCAYYTKGRNPAELFDETAENLYPYLSMDFLRGRAQAMYAPLKPGLYLVEEGQPLIIWDGSNSGEFVKGKKGVLSSTMAAANLKNNRIDSNFYWYLCSSFEEQMRRYAIGMGIPHVDGEELRSIYLPIPEIKEQVQIAKFLDHETAKIDTLISKQERLIELLQEKRQAVISHAVTKGLDGAVGMKDSGVEWLGEVPEHWLTTSFKHKISTTKGVAFKSADFVSEGVKVVRASDIKNKTIQYSGVYLPVAFLNEYKNVMLKTGDIVLSTVGSTPDVKNSAVGQVGMLPLDLNGSLLNQNTVIFAPEENLNNNYLFWLIQSSMYREHLNLNAHGTANQASLSLESMLSFRVVIPDYDEQLLIHNYLEDRVRKLDKLEKNSQDMISLLKERRTALISAAVTGKIDVRDIELQ